MLTAAVCALVSSLALNVLLYRSMMMYRRWAYAQWEERHKTLVYLATKKDRDTAEMFSDANRFRFLLRYAQVERRQGTESWGIRWLFVAKLDADVGRCTTLRDAIDTSMAVQLASASPEG